MRTDTTVSACRICRFIRDDGSVIEATMTPALARLIARMDEAEARKEERRKRKEKTFTDLRIDGGRVTQPYRSPRLDGYPWEGPRYTFDRLIGESRIWAGPRLEDVLPLALERLQADARDEWARVARPGRPEPCEFCHGVRLEVGEFCLRCNRSGRDNDPLLRVTKTDLARRTRSPRKDGLKGGR